MKTLEAEVARLVEAKGVHRKGWSIDQLAIGQMLSHAEDELWELDEAIEENLPEHDQLDEMGDVLCCLFHIMNRKGWSVDMVEGAAIKKLQARWHY